MKFAKRLRKFIVSHKTPLFLLAIFLFSMWTVAIGFQLQHKNDTPLLGVSFSTKYAKELGNDWQKNYLALLDELEIKHFRLMSYWDEGEPQNDVFVFDELDWQIDQATRHGATVSLALGQRQPRWPECHVPKWAVELETEDMQTYRNELKEYITHVVERYRDTSAVVSYQIENEAANSMFGDCSPYSPEFLSEEIDLVRKLDPDAEIITNVSNQSGTPLFGPVSRADKVGFSIYKKAYFEALGRQNKWSFWYVPSQWHSLRAAIVENIVGKDVFIHELQAEPWGPEATVNLSREKQDESMDSEQLKAIVAYAEQTGMKEAYLWGGEWWYWRHTQFNDDELWKTLKEIY